MAHHDARRSAPLMGRALTPTEIRRLSVTSRQRARRGPPSLGRDVAALVRVLLCGSPAAVAVAVVALGYLVLTADAVPDLVPLVGLVDDAGVLSAAVAAARGLNR